MADTQLYGQFFSFTIYIVSSYADLCDFIHFQIPGAYNVHIVSYFTATPEALEVLREEMSTSSAAEGASASQDQSWKVALRRFWAADQEYCDERFKLVPSIVSPMIEL